MGKKNRNRGRDRYDDIYDSLGGNDFEYDGNFQSNYQEEIENVEFIDAESSAQDSGHKESTYSTDKNIAKSQAAEERDSWDFIKAKMDQTFSKFDEKKPTSVKNGLLEKNGVQEKNESKPPVAGTEQTSETEQTSKEVKPKGPNPVTLFLGKIRAFAGTLGAKLKSVSKRKAKPENPQGETETTEETSKPAKNQNSLKSLAEKATEKASEKSVGKTSEVSSEAVPENVSASAKTGTGKKFFSFLKKKAETPSEVPSGDAENATGKTVENAAKEGKISPDVKTNEKGNPKADETGDDAGDESVGSQELSVEAQMRQKRKTYLILGSITMSIVVLLLIGVVLLIVGKSGKEVAQTTQNTESNGSASSTDSALSTGSSLTEVLDQDLSLLPAGSDSEKSAPFVQTASQTTQSSQPTKTAKSEQKTKAGKTSKTNKTGKTSQTPENEKGKEKNKTESEPQSLDSDLGLDSLGDFNLSSDSSASPAAGENSTPEAASAGNSQEDLTVADVLNSDSGTAEANPKNARTSQAKTDSLDSLLADGGLTETQPEGNTKTEPSTEEQSGLGESADLGAALALPEVGDSSLTAPDASNAANQSAQTGSALTEETPSLENSLETADDSLGSDATELDGGTAAQPADSGTVAVAPTIARAENANTLPEGLETPEGVVPGSNVEEWNSSTEDVPESFTAPQNSDAGTKPEEKTEANPLAAPTDESAPDPLAGLSDSPAGTSTTEPAADPLAGLSDSPAGTSTTEPATDPLAGLSDSPAGASATEPAADPLAGLSDSPAGDSATEPAADPLAGLSDSPMDAPNKNPTSNKQTKESASSSEDPFTGLSDSLASEPDPLAGDSAETSAGSTTKQTTGSTAETTGNLLSESSEVPADSTTADPTKDSLAGSSSDLNGDELSSPGGLDDLESPAELESESSAPSDSVSPPSALGSLNISKEQVSGKADGKKEAEYTNYTSVKDDSFWKISEKFYQTPAYENALARFNIDVVPNPNNLKEGTVLQIPALDFLRSCYPTLCPPLPSTAQVPADGKNGTKLRGVQFYCVAEGDTLSLIAEKLLGDASRWPEIYRMNTEKVQNLDLLPVGEKLQIPMDEAIPPQKIWQ